MTRGAAMRPHDATTARPRRAPADAGMTMSEVIVVMLVGSIVLTLIGALTIGLIRGNSQNLARQTQIDEARSAVTWLSRALGQAVAPRTLSDRVEGDIPLIAASGTELTFYAHLDNPTGNGTDPAGPTLVTFAVRDGVLHRISQRPDHGSTFAGWTFTCDAVACPELHEDLVVARGVADRLFRFVDASGAPLPADGAAAPLTAAELAAVDAVEVSVVIGSDEPAESTGTTTVLRRVSLPDWSRF